MSKLDLSGDTPASLEDVLCTEELRRRPSRPPDHAAENRALTALAETMAHFPRAILQKLVDSALELCRADSAGISILEKHGEEDVFRWHAIAGQFSVNAGQSMARNASPCGTVLDRDAALLFMRPERHFNYSVALDSPLVETLLAPFHADGRPVGTVWVIAHTENRHFDSEDARLLNSLSRFAAAAYQMIGALHDAEVGRIEMERQVAERTRELSEALTATRQIAGGVAHELRNPLQAVKTSIYYLNNAPDIRPEKRAEHMQRIDRHLLRAEDIITILTNFVRLREPDKHCFAADSCIQNAIADSGVPDRIELAIDLPADLPSVIADKEQVRIVLGNLIRNAVEAMPSNGRLTISGMKLANTVEIAISDTGTGIAPGDLQRIMEPHYSTKARGLGLGLSLSQAMIRKNGGSLHVTSEPGRGSMFSIRLPAAAAMRIDNSAST